MPDAGAPFLRPSWTFITTGGTIISTTGSPEPAGAWWRRLTAWGVAVWQQPVYYNVNSANPLDPDLQLQDATCLNPQLYAGLPSYKVFPTPWPESPLTSPTTPLAELDVPDDPDPATVDD